MRVLSLFSGCGGLDLGFVGGFECFSKCINEKMHPDWIICKHDNKVMLKPTGFEIVFANDILPQAKTAWTTYFKDKVNNANNTYVLASIVDLVKQYYAGKYQFPKDIDLVIGGFPCQDFSVAGKRQGFNSFKSHDGSIKSSDNCNNETRGNLYWWMKEVISITKPKMFIAENVKGLISLEDALKTIQNDFASIDNNAYLIIPAQVLHVANYGVAQNRERVIFYGFRKDALTNKSLKELSNLTINSEYNPLPFPTHNYNVTNSLNLDLKPFVTCKDILSGLAEPKLSCDLSQQKYSGVKYLKGYQGNIEIDLNSIAPTIRSEHHGHIEFRRLSKKHGGYHVAELSLGLKERRLSVRECARIQSFPDDYLFVNGIKGITNGISASVAYRLIGNAVPPLFAYHLAMRIKENWDKYFK